MSTDGQHGNSAQAQAPNPTRSPQRPQRPSSFKGPYTKYHVQKLRKQLDEFIQKLSKFCCGRLGDMEKFLREHENYRGNASDIYELNFEVKLNSVCTGIINVFKIKASRIGRNLSSEGMESTLTDISNEVLKPFRALCMFNILKIFHVIFQDLLFSNTRQSTEFALDFKRMTLIDGDEIPEELFDDRNYAFSTVIELFRCLLLTVEQKPVVASRYNYPNLELLKDNFIQYFEKIVLYSKEIFSLCVSMGHIAGIQSFSKSLNKGLFMIFSNLSIIMTQKNCLKFIDMLLTLQNDIHSVFIKNFPSLPEYQIIADHSI